LERSPPPKKTQLHFSFKPQNLRNHQQNTKNLEKLPKHWKSYRNLKGILKIKKTAEIR